MRFISKTRQCDSCRHGCQPPRSGAQAKGKRRLRRQWRGRARGAGQPDARGVASTPNVAQTEAKAITNTGVEDIVATPPRGTAPIERPWFDKKTTAIEDRPRPRHQQVQPVGQRLEKPTTGIEADQRSLGHPTPPRPQHQQLQQQQQKVKKPTPTQQAEETKVDARDAASGKGTDRPGTENRLQGKSVDKPPQGAGTKGTRDPGYPAWLQYRSELVKRFPLLETHLAKRPIYRARGEPGLYEESVFTGSARLSWQVYLRKGRPVKYPKPHIQDSVQIDDIDRHGWLVDIKMVGIGAGREIKPAHVPNVVEEIGRGSSRRTYPLFGEPDQQKLLDSSTLQRRTGSPACAGRPTRRS